MSQNCCFICGETGFCKHREPELRYLFSAPEYEPTLLKKPMQQAESHSEALDDLRGELEYRRERITARARRIVS